jgi:putative glycosyltransferase (TIGR04372 family)
VKQLLVKLIGSFLIKVLEMVNFFHPLRFSFLDGLRIGQLTIFPETYLRERERGEHRELSGVTHIFFSEKACNKTLMGLIKRKISVVESNWIYRSIMRLEEIRKHPLFYEIDISKRGLHYHSHFLKVEGMSHQLSFSDEEERIGQQFLKEMGLGESDWFVCFHNRDPTYLNALPGESRFNYHNYRDSSISEYLSAIEWLSSTQGAFCFRMGEKTSEPLPSGLNLRVIDYASQYRSDFLDIYLLSKAKFVIGTSCGLMQVPSIFNTPIAFVNMISVDVHGYSKRDLFIPKKLVWKESRKPLRYTEILSLGAESWSRGEQYEEAGIEVVENSSAEILELVQEMLQHIDGTLELSNEYLSNFQLFRKHFDSRHFCSQIEVYVSPQFLKNSPELYQ